MGASAWICHLRVTSIAAGSGRGSKGDNTMLNRRAFGAALVAAIAFPGLAAAQANTPSAAQIERKLEAAPRVVVPRNKRVTVRELKRRPEMRRIAPSIDIQSINFAFGSAEIGFSQYPKVENIATAMERILRRNRREVFLIEGHTDAVGSFASNQALSEDRAASLRSVLVREFGIPRRALETVGYGEEFLLVPTQNENWRNRRVTLRRVTDVIEPF
jgi:outer membrane protein OmpA-like peptidoglycan-associated protein